MLSNYNELNILISERLECHAAHIDFSERHFISDVLVDDVDNYVSAIGMKRIGKGWRQILRKDAIATLTYILHCSQAYQTELLPETIAEQAAIFFVELFSRDNALFLTNCDINYLGRSGFSWDSLTDSTFDIALIGVDNKYNGIICIEDED
jgi:hypothetical protein